MKLAYKILSALLVLAFLVAVTPASPALAAPAETWPPEQVTVVIKTTNWGIQVSVPNVDAAKAACPGGSGYVLPCITVSYQASNAIKPTSVTCYSYTSCSVPLGVTIKSVTVRINLTYYIVKDPKGDGTYTAKKCLLVC